MGQDYFDFLIDLALDGRDFEWIKELKEKQRNFNKEGEASIRGKTSHNIAHDDIFITSDTDFIISDTGVVLEDLESNYAVIDDYGISNLIDENHDIVMNKEIIYCTDLYKKGELGEYLYLDYEKQNYIKGLLMGQKMQKDMFSEMLDDLMAKADEEENKKKWWQFWKRDE